VLWTSCSLLAYTGAMKSAIQLLALSLAMVLATPAPALACSPLYLTSSEVLTTDAPSCLTLTGLETTDASGMRAGLSVANGCDATARVTCVREDPASATLDPCVPQEVPPGEAAVLRFVASDTLRWEVHGAAGEIVVAVEGRWSACPGSAGCAGAAGGPLDLAAWLALAFGAAFARLRRPSVSRGSLWRDQKRLDERLVARLHG